MMTFIIVSIVAATDVAPPDFFAGNEELRGYLLEAGENHPGLQMRYEEWLAALERTPQVRSLEDPMLTYGQFLQSEVNRFKFMVSQKFPWFGTRKTRGEKTEAEAEAALARLYAERNRIFADVKRAYFDYALLADSVTIVASQIEILQYVEATAQARYSFGMSMQSDVVRAQMALTELQDRHAGLLEYRAAVSARLCETLGRSVAEELPWPQKGALPPMPPPAPIVSARLRVTNPELHALEHVIGSREKDVALARKKGYPDFTLGFEFLSVSKPRQIRPDRPYPSTLYALQRQNAGFRNGIAGLRQAFGQLLGGQPVQLAANPPTAIDLIDYYAIGTANEPMSYSDGGDDNIAITLQMNVPIYRKRVNAGISEAKHLRRAAEHRKHQKANTLDTMARQMLFEIWDRRRRLNTLSTTLTVQAQQIYENLQTAYASATGDASFLDVLQSVQDLLNFELETAEVTRDLQVAAAELEFLMGGPWAQTPEETTVESELE